MSEPQDVHLTLPDGQALRPVDTQHSVTDTGQRWIYTFRPPSSLSDPEAIGRELASALARGIEARRRAGEQAGRSLAQMLARIARGPGLPGDTGANEAGD